MNNSDTIVETQIIRYTVETQIMFFVKFYFDAALFFC